MYSGYIKMKSNRKVVTSLTEADQFISNQSKIHKMISSWYYYLFQILGVKMSSHKWNILYRSQKVICTVKMDGWGVDIIEFVFDQSQA